MYPQWTEEITERYVKGEDQLGIQGTAQSYQQYLVPGVITTTDRARYYSFYAWVLYRFITDSDSSRLLKDFRGSYFKRHEVALILASFSHHKDQGGLSGLVGSGLNNSKAQDYWEQGDPISLDQDYFQNSLGGFGQYYRTSMQVMGIIREPERAGLVYRLTDKGKRLAEAYEESIAATHYFSRLSSGENPEFISHQDAKELGEGGCICREALSQGKDLALLKKAFFRTDQVGNLNPHVRRRLTLGVTLDLVQAGDGKITQDQFRPALYLGEYSANFSYKSSDVLKHWVRRWNMVQIRHMYTFGLEVLWAVFLEILKKADNGITFDEFLTYLREELFPEPFSQEVSTYLNSICGQIDLEEDWKNSSERYKEIAGYDTEENEYALYLEAIDNKNDISVLFNAGYKILLKLFLRFYSDYRAEDDIWKELARQQRLPMNKYFSSFEARLASERFTFEDFFRWIYQDFILGQHEFIALGKLRYQNYDTFKFYYQDGRFYWPYVSRDAYHEPIRFATLRLFNTLSLLKDMGLISEKDDECLELTSEGEDKLQEILEIDQNVH